MAVYQRNKVWYFRFQIKGREYCRAVPEATDKKAAEKAEVRAKNDLFQGKWETAEGVGEMFFNALVEKFIGALAKVIERRHRQTFF